MMWYEICTTTQHIFDISMTVCNLNYHLNRHWYIWLLKYQSILSYIAIISNLLIFNTDIHLHVCLYDFIFVLCILVYPYRNDNIMYCDSMTNVNISRCILRHMCKYDYCIHYESNIKVVIWYRSCMQILWTMISLQT
jgi:hypothetical protein